MLFPVLHSPLKTTFREWHSVVAWKHELQKNCLRAIFMEWRNHLAQRQESLSGRREDLHYIRRRCVFRFMLWEPSFKKAIAHLWNCIDMLICGPEGFAMVQTLHMAIVSMPSFFIKICSYEGACLRRRSGCTRFKHYSWYDPSNYVYAQMWYLLVRYSQSTLRKAHLFSKSDVRLKCRHVVAQRMLDIHSRACVRWPTVSPLKHYNRLGDLLEFVLGRCYCDARGRLNSMLHIISDIAFWVRDIEHAVWHNQLTQPRSRIAADTWAKGVYWIYEMQRHNEVQCHNYRYSREEEKFDKWASEMKYCFQ